MRACRDCSTSLEGCHWKRLYCDTCRLARRRMTARAASQRYADSTAENASQRWKAIKTKYGLTPIEYEAMLVLQGGLCAMLCGQPATRIDHCHETGKVRGLLCHGCNIRLSGIEDREFRARALTYLGEEVNQDA